jgi:hypothetical protein
LGSVDAIDGGRGGGEIESLKSSLVNERYLPNQPGSCGLRIQRDNTWISRDLAGEERFEA